MMASLIHEYISKLTNNRSRFLAKALSQLLKDEFINQVDFGQLIYTHPLIAGLKETADTYPSYIPGDVFATALIDCVCDYGIEYEFTGQDNSNSTTLIFPVQDPNRVIDPYADYNRTVKSKLLESGLKKTLESFLINTKDYNGLKTNIEQWYGHYMDRISGWYKKDTASKMILIGWALALLFNVDTINIFKTLKTNNALNYSIAAAAQNYVETTDVKQMDTVTVAQVRQLKSISDSLEFPVGYKFSVAGDNGNKFLPMYKNFKTGLVKQMKSDGGILLMFIGWFISALAISRGAPFWFDLLSKFVNLRMTGTKPSKPKS
jgi:hypothetical protein